MCTNHSNNALESFTFYLCTYRTPEINTIYLWGEFATTLMCLSEFFCMYAWIFLCGYFLFCLYFSLVMWIKINSLTTTVCWLLMGRVFNLHIARAMQPINDQLGCALWRGCKTGLHFIWRARSHNQLAVANKC